MDRRIEAEKTKKEVIKQVEKEVAEGGVLRLCCCCSPHCRYFKSDPKGQKACSDPTQVMDMGAPAPSSNLMISSINYPVLCCAVLCCAVLCCAVLCCAVLCCTVLYCAVLYYTVLYSTLLYSTLLYSNLMHFIPNRFIRFLYLIISTDNPTSFLFSCFPFLYFLNPYLTLSPSISMLPLF